MPSKINQTAGSVKGRIFTIAGQIQREQADLQAGEFRLMAYVFDKAGSLLGSEALDEKGGYNVAVKLRKPADVDLFVGPADMAEQIRSSSAFSHSFSAGDWKGEGGLFRLRFDTLIPVEIWRPWWPLRICVSGHVRKVSQQNGATEICPVPFVKVEIFDVDREFCYWPYLRNWWELLLDRPVFRIPDLLRDPPIPIPPLPGPDPAPDLNFDPIPGIRRNFGGSLLERVGLNPQPLPPREVEGMAAISARSFELRSQPDLRNLASAPVSGRVGEARLIDKSIASRMDKLTLTSKIAPWVTFSKCFYSKVEVCETTTDCDGYFNCCFTSKRHCTRKHFIK